MIEINWNEISKKKFFIILSTLILIPQIRTTLSEGYDESIITYSLPYADYPLLKCESYRDKEYKPNKKEEWKSHYYIAIIIKG